MPEPGRQPAAVLVTPARQRRLQLGLQQRLDEAPDPKPNLRLQRIEPVVPVAAGPTVLSLATGAFLNRFGVFSHS